MSSCNFQDFSGKIEISQKIRSFSWKLGIYHKVSSFPKKFQVFYENLGGFHNFWKHSRL